MARDDEPMMVSVSAVCWIVAGMILGALFFAMHGYQRGVRHGACVEMCRPARFDDDQDVNGGCLCIGSDKVLRFKEDLR